MSSIVFPAEWHTQDIVQLTWPHRHTDFAPIYDEVVKTFVTIAHKISTYQKLLIVCKHIEETRQHLQHIPQANIILVQCNTQDVWARDHAAITVYKNNIPQMYDFTFNGWGRKFEYEIDNEISSHIHSHIFSKVKLHNHRNFVLEGGAIESNGAGVMLTTKACMLNPNRNADADIATIESTLKTLFGLQKILWLSHGYLEGDDTDSHIDTLARFVDEETICYVACADESDVHYAEFMKMKQELTTFTQLNGAPFRLVALPHPPAIYGREQYRLPATYANFLILNKAVLVPTYNCTTDAEAIAIFTQLFPNHSIEPINCTTLIEQHGSLHCVTMQYPQGVL